MRLQGKIALITGAGSGIGRACALSFASEGARVGLMGRRRELLDETAVQIAQKSGDDAAFVFAGDVADPNDIRRAVFHTASKFGGLNVLVNNAGVLHPGTLESHTDAEWDDTFDVNVRAVWQLTREVLPHMRRAGKGSVINISSVIGLVGARNRVAYAASKGAVTLMTKAMALDHAAEQIRVNCICPGVVDTELVAGFVRNSPDPEAALKQRVAWHPMGCFGQPEDIASCALYLASDESSWVTGAAFPIDGGYTAK